MEFNAAEKKSGKFFAVMRLLPRGSVQFCECGIRKLEIDRKESAMLDTLLELITTLLDTLSASAG
ncbi:hypothetical protein AB0H71_13505 [Nocardia sp. NPDC050697]|uniref:hypothetical protein n=1 Tax=Nocardia sp. NPDC050697 TaxID=3155158 RepID=UPI0033FCFB7E